MTQALAQSRTDQREKDWEKVYATIRANDLQGLQALLRRGISANPSDRRQITMLMSAAEVGHLAGIARAPIEDGDFTRTALGIRALKAYGTPGRQMETKARIEKARQWLLHTEPVTTEDLDMRLVGAAGAGRAGALKGMAWPILEHQRADRGWAQRDELASDAYATGMTLWALAESGIVRPSDRAYRRAYQRGVRFLLPTRHQDGSWFVASRSVKFQPYFHGGFPDGHDQWISMATGWATNALVLGLAVPSIPLLLPNRNMTGPVIEEPSGPARRHFRTFANWETPNA
jgi:hypothetical protein